MPRYSTRGGGGGGENDGIKFPPGVKDISATMNRTELSRAFKKCCRCFSDLDQGNETIMSEYKEFVEFIVQDEFLEMKDNNCCVFLGCLITDIFRVYAPNNPFQTTDKIKEIFIFVTSQLSLLKDPKDPSYHKAYHILSNMASLKCYNICLELDLESSAEVFVDLFRTLLSIVNSGNDKNLKDKMLDVMTFVISDSTCIPKPLIDLILESLLDKSQRMNPSAFELSKELLRRTATVIEQPIMAYFQKIAIANHPVSEKMANNWDKLIPILYSITPGLLLNTLPQFELKLKVDNPKERLQTVRLFSGMFSAKDSDLAVQYSKLWNSFLGRFNDIEAEVRIACVNFYWSLLNNHGCESKLSKETLPYFKQRRHDTDENVRLSVVCAIRGIAINNIKLISDDLLECLKDRVKDKKWKVREGAMRAMADIYKKYVTIDECHRPDVRRIHPFRDSLLHVYYHNNSDDSLLLERILISSLVPYKLPPQNRMKLLLELYATVDENALKAIGEIIKNQRRMKMALLDVVKSFNIKDDKERSEVIWQKSLAVSSLIPGSTQVVRENVKKFVRISYQDGRMKQLLTYIVSEDYTCKKIETAIRDILKKLDGEASRQVKHVSQQILERAVILPIIIDTEALKALFELVKESLDSVSDVDELNGEEAQKRAIGLLRLLSQLTPHIFNAQECYEDLLGFIRRQNSNIVDESLLIFQKTAQIVENKFPKIRSVLLPELKMKAKTGTPKQAKRAIYCIAEMSSISETALLSIYDYCKTEIQSKDCEMEKLQTSLTAIGCIAEVLPAKVSRTMRSLVASVVVKEVIMKTTLTSPTLSSPSKSKKNASYWCDKKAIGRESKAKIAAFKCMVRWLQGMKRNEANVVCSTLRLLEHVLHNNGDLMKTGNIPKTDMSHLRLQSALCILKIAQVANYRDLFQPVHYQELAMLVNDPEMEVRRIFVNRLYSSLVCLQINISFLSLFAMVSQETNKIQRNRGTVLYQQLVKRFRDFNKEKGIGSTSPSNFTPEYMLPYLIYLLADDPDFQDGISKRSLARIKDCVQFALEPLLVKTHPESFGFIKRLAENVKRTKNAEEPDSVQRNENIYAVCDLVCLYVIQRSAQFAVGVMEPDDRSVARFIPSKLFTLPSGPENEKYYLPREFYLNLKKQIPTPPPPTPSIPTKPSTPPTTTKQTQKKTLLPIRKLAPVVVSSPSVSTTMASNKKQQVATTSGSRASPTSGSRASPKSGTRASPKSGSRASPKSGSRASPKSGSRASPKSGTRASPKSGSRASPKSGTRASPKTSNRASPKKNNNKPTEEINSSLLTPPNSEPTKSDKKEQSSTAPTSPAAPTPTRTSGRKRKLPRRLEHSPSPPRTTSASSSPSKRSKQSRTTVVTSPKVMTSPKNNSKKSSTTKDEDSMGDEKSLSSSDEDSAPLSSLIDRSSASAAESSQSSSKRPSRKKQQQKQKEKQQQQKDKPQKQKPSRTATTTGKKTTATATRNKQKKKQTTLRNGTRSSLRKR